MHAWNGYVGIGITASKRQRSVERIQLRMIGTTAFNKIDLMEMERSLSWIGDNKGLNFQSRAINPILCYLGESYIDATKTVSLAFTLLTPNF